MSRGEDKGEVISEMLHLLRNDVDDMVAEPGLLGHVVRIWCPRGCELVGQFCVRSIIFTGVVSGMKNNTDGTVTSPFVQLHHGHPTKREHSIAGSTYLCMTNKYSRYIVQYYKPVCRVWRGGDIGEIIWYCTLERMRLITRRREDQVVPSWCPASSALLSKTCIA